MMHLRHYCGELVHVQYFSRGGGRDEEIFVFFQRGDREGLQDPIEICPNCDEALDIDFCGSPWLIEPMPFTVASITSKRRHCSNCWGFEFEMHVAKIIDGSETVDFYLACIDCKEDTIGYVSMGWITHAKAEDHIYFRNDIEDICGALGVDLPDDYQKKEKQSEAETLRELGF